MTDVCMNVYVYVYEMNDTTRLWLPPPRAWRWAKSMVEHCEKSSKQLLCICTLGLYVLMLFFFFFSPNGIIFR